MQTARTLHYFINRRECVPGYTQLSYFSFDGDKLNVGQCQSVKTSELDKEVAALRRNGRTEASYKFVSGKPVLVPAAKPTGAA